MFHAMPTQLRPRQERFVRLFHKYDNARRAYAEAGYRARRPRHSRESSAVDACASKLLKHPKVEQRLQELRAMAANRHLITVDTLLADLEEDRQLAHREGQAGGAVAASMSKARLLGLVIDRTEKGAPGEFAQAQTVEDVIAVVRKDLGDEAADALARLVAPATAAARPAPDVEPLDPSRDPDATLN